MNTAHSVEGGRLARNAVFNLAGQVLPLFSGVALIPYIVRGLGPERFGMLGIIWVVFGYFSLMDLGLGRATTKFLAEWLAKGEERRISEMVWSSIVLQLLMGLVGGVIIAALTPLLVERVLRTPPSLMLEGRLAFYILAAALPVVLAMNGFRAVLEGCQRFDISNLLRVPSSILAFAVPAAGVAVGLRLPGIVLCLAAFRLLFALVHGFYCLQVLPCLKTRPAIHSGMIFHLLSFGGWVTASNVVNPILLTVDRFFVGSLLSVALVGYYTAPYEAVTKLWVIPTSLMTTVYPVCSALSIESAAELQVLYSRSIKYIFCALAPISLVLTVFARPIIGLWLGPTFVDKSTVALQVLAVGVFINCFAQVPYAFLQALGRPDAAAKLFLLELPPYVLLSWWMVGRYGIAGAALGWSIRVALEVVLLLWMTRKLVSLSATHVFDRGMWAALGALSVTAVAAYLTNVFFRGALLAEAGMCALCVAGFALASWKWVLDSVDRSSALAVLAPLWSLARSFGDAEG